MNIREPFLHQVASTVIERFGNQLFKVGFVFPNKRQSVYFDHYLHQLLSPPVLLPELLTIEGLLKRCSDFALADGFRQSIALYEAYCAYAKKQGEEPPGTYEDFYALGEVLLADLNEVEAYMAPLAKLFSIIADYKAIDQSFADLTEEQLAFLKGFWQSLQVKDQFQEKFIDLWGRIAPIHAIMKARLESEGFASMGSMYLHLGLNAASYRLPDVDHLVFVGFNAFNKAEETILKTWQQAGYASFYFDADAFYVNDPLHEAGFFLRRNLQQVGLKNTLAFSNNIPVSGNVPADIPAITVTKVDGQVAQAKLVTDWVQQLPADLPPGKAAILLADEKLLLPVLQSIPAGKHAVNVTMGFPVLQSPVYGLIELFFDAQIAMEGQPVGRATLGWELVMKWLQHPLCDWAKEDIDKWRNKLIKQGIHHQPVAPLQKFAGIGKWIFTPTPGHNNLFIWLRSLLQEVVQSAITNGDGLLQGLVVGMYDQLNSMEPYCIALKDLTKLAFLKAIIMKPLGALSVPFEAESTAGIQVMGLLESRGLDFEYILLLGGGEGSLPRAATAKTFIPYNLRKAYGLSTMEHQDAIFAYVFYRLLHKCKHMEIVYNGLTTDSSTGEVSRFVQQVAFETAIPISYRHWQMEVKATPSNIITIAKTPEVLNRLRKYYLPGKQVGISPSAINKYLTCRLQFFFQYIANLHEPDEMLTEIDPAIFGSAVHILLQKLYDKWLQQQAPDKTVTEQAIDTMLTWLPGMLQPALKEAWSGKEKKSQGPPMEGFAIVVADVVAEFAIGFLKHDKLLTPFTVHNLETTFKYELEVPTVDGVKSLLLKGNIDRVDEKDGTVRMVDYKTGGDRVDFRSLDELFEPHGAQLNKGALQTLIYAWIFGKEQLDFKYFEPALVILRQLNISGKNEVKLFEKSTKTLMEAAVLPDVLEKVEANLQTLLTEMFNPQIPFDQTHDLRTCGYCDYKGICGR